MFKIVCILALTVTVVISLPVDSTTESKGLNRPSPINPEVISDPKPKEVSTSSPEKTTSTEESHIQKIPATGAKLSSEVDQTKPTQRRGNRRDRTRSTTTTTTTPKNLSEETSEPSKAPETTKKVKRAVESSEGATTRSASTTRAPIISSADENDNTPPHFVRPIPVEQILKNVHEAPKQHEPSVSLHDHVTSAAPITDESDDSEDKPEDKPKSAASGRKPLHGYKKKQEEQPSDAEEDNPSDEDKKDQ
ncbi:uncharacterized protein LOC134215731 [Armigeres subalbatus]|uniref:uncharacterized protein LOC134215731 n=1 Tax=Armigeres subalbatus TaxID=124917 RepID=UPI002ED1813F